MSMLIPALVGAGSTYLSSASQRKAANRAGDVAMGLSQEQRAILSELLKNMQTYGGPFLEHAYEWATKPGESAYQRNIHSRGVEDINKAYRPAYAQELAGLSSRNLLSTPNSYAAPAVSAMDRARSQAISRYTTDWRSRQEGEEGQRLSQFGNILAQLTGGQVSGAGAYSEPISTMGGLAAEGAAGQYDWLTALIRLYGLMQQAQKQGQASP